jgi:hypothetical protein
VPLQLLPCVATRADPLSHLLLEWEAFVQLSTDRPVGLTRGAIPWSSIDRYSARHGIDGDDFNRFCALIRAMDAAYLAYFKDKPPSAQP